MSDLIERSKQGCLTASDETALAIVARFSWSSNMMRYGKLIGQQYLVATAISEALEAAKAYSKSPSSPAFNGMVEALKASLGYLMNAKIDLETGAPKRTAIRTIEGGLKVVAAALAKAEASGNCAEGWHPISLAPANEWVLVCNPDEGPLPLIAKRVAQTWYMQPPFRGSHVLDKAPTLWTRWPAILSTAPELNGNCDLSGTNQPDPRSSLIKSSADRLIAAAEAIQREIESRKERLPAWFGGKPVFSIPLVEIMTSEGWPSAYITLEALKTALENSNAKD